MNSTTDLIASRTKDPEFHWPLPLAIAVWVVIVWGFGRFLATPQVETPPSLPIDARIVELPEPHPTATPTVPEQPPPTPMRVSPKRAPVKKTVVDKPQPVPEKATLSAKPPVETPQSPDPAPHPPATDEMGARAVYQPIPRIPEELRDAAINAVAVARFHIGADGTATVELSKPTPDPRINQVILNTLKTWRFFPALRHGTPVPSLQDIKVAVDVN